MAPRSALSQVFVNGFPDGANPDHSIDRLKSTEARYIQDAFIDLPPDIIRRGPVIPVAGVPTLIEPGSSIFWCRDPAGTVKIAVISGTSASGTNINIMNSGLTAYDATIQLFAGHSYTTPYLFDVKPALKGGVYIGISAKYGLSAGVQRLIYWRGGNKAQYNPANVTATAGSTAVTGVGTTFNTSVSPGMFLYNSGGAYLMGVVKTVNSNTSITLEEPSLGNIVAAGARFDSFRGFQPRVASGVITVASGAVDVVGSNTKFVDEGVAAGHNIYRALDNKLLGTVTSVTDNLALVMSASTDKMNADDYFIVNSAPDFTTDLTAAVEKKPGFLNTIYARRQWFANRSKARDTGGGFTDRLWYSSPDDPEAVDMSPDGGSYFTLAADKESGAPIRALIPTTTALLALKDREVFGIFGTTPDTFESKKVGDDGTLSAMAATTYGSSAIWAGREGIYLWDGTETINLIENNLQKTYSSLVKSLPSDTVRAWATVKRDYYILDIFNGVSAISPSFGDGTGTQDYTPEAQDHFTVLVHIPTKAAIFLSNFAFRGSAEIPHDNGDLWWYIVNTQNNLETNGNFEAGIAGWTGLGLGSPSWGSTNNYVGTKSMVVGMSAVADGAEGNSILSPNPGDSIKITFRIYSAAGGESIKVNFREYTNVGGFVRQSAGTTGVLRPGWNTLTKTDTYVGGGAVDHLRAAVSTTGFLVFGSTITVDYVQVFNITNPAWVNYIADFLPLLDTQGLDTIVTEQNVPGPFLYLESGGISADDPTLKKRWRNMLFHYYSNNDSLTAEVVTNFRDTGTVLSTVFPATTAWAAKLIRFMSSAQILRFKLYQTSRSPTTVKIGPGSLGYKPQRRGVV